MIRTLIVDDSPLVRAIIRDFLESDGSFEIIAEAENGLDGVTQARLLNPDLITMDIEMPVMNGLDAIVEIKKNVNTAIVVISTHDTAKMAYEATAKGAHEFFAKDLFTSQMGGERHVEIIDTLKHITSIKKRIHDHSDTVKQIAIKGINTAGLGFEKARPASAACGGFPQQSCGVLNPSFPHSLDHARASTVAISLRSSIKPRKINAVVIAASTGGPMALCRLFTALPGELSVPIILVQHNTSGFDRSFAQWLDGYTPLNVCLAEEGTVPSKGNIYVAPTDRHLLVGDSGIMFDDSEPINSQKPAADLLFKSAASFYGEGLVSVVLTGMGSDGADGTRYVKQAGGVTIAQDEASSMIYGMPYAAAETGCVDIVLPLDEIAPELIFLTRG